MASLAATVRRHRSWLLALVVAAAAPVTLAFAQDAGTRGPDPAERKPADKPADKPTDKPAGAPAVPHVEGEGEEPDHPPAPAPKPAPPPKQPVVVKEGMARIPGGRFTMGSDDKKAPPNERPSRIVIVSPFWIDKTEVTVGAYRECVERGACPRPARSSTSCTYDAGDPQLPVSCVPWTSAQAFCVAVSKRLPREVEWEMAARGTSAMKYPWGGGSAAGCGAAVTLAGDATQRSCGTKNRPARVGSHPGGASPFGAVDMSGNVEEWVSDWYGDTVSDLSPRAGASHVLRGGSWLSRPSDAKTTSRNWGSAREMGPTVGFRCARDD
jgi:serine/threonine-protein kinase